MRDFSRTALFLAVTAFPLLFPIAGQAEVPPSPAAETAEIAKKPVLIIRFNQPGVHYKNPLRQVAAQAQEIKPDVNFELLTLVPVFEERDKNTTSKQIAEYNADKVAKALASFNIQPDHIRIRYQESTAVSMNEIHVIAY